MEETEQHASAVGSRPHWLFVAGSLLVIAIALLFIAGPIGGALAGDPFSFLGLFLALPLGGFIGWKQYSGTFRRNASAARVAGTSLYVCAALWFFVLMTTTGTMLDGSFRNSVALTFLAILLSLVVGLGLMGRANRLWSKRLIEAGVAPRNQLTLRELFAATAAVGFVLAMVISTRYDATPRTADHVTVQEADIGLLPDDAYDVSYHRGWRGTLIMEFSIDEAGFRRWFDSDIGTIESNSDGPVLKPIVGGTRIQRFNYEQADVSHGCEYSWSKADRHIQAVFDSDQQRAYYFRSLH